MPHPDDLNRIDLQYGEGPYQAAISTLAFELADAHASESECPGTSGYSADDLDDLSFAIDLLVELRDGTALVARRSADLAAFTDAFRAALGTLTDPEGDPR